MNCLSSLQNPKVKAVVRLHQRKHRDAENRILVEGQHPVAEALALGVVLEDLFVTDPTFIPPGYPDSFTVVSPDVMAKMSTTDSPAPILAVAQKPAQPERSFLKKPQVKLLALLDLQDPGNVGTLIRAACAFGLQGLIMVGQAVDPFHPKIIRSSAGMIFKLPVLSEPNVSSLFSTLDTYGPFQIWAADAHQGQSYKHTNFGTKWVLLMGSEAHGIPQDAWDKAQAIHIPSEPQVESLNVAVAGAILMAEAYQQERPLSPR